MSELVVIGYDSEDKAELARIELFNMSHEYLVGVYDAVVATADAMQPVLALNAGLLILVMPRLLNYVVAAYLILIGLTGILAHLGYVPIAA